MEHNVGLGPALDAGLAASDHEIVARMDADDVSLPDRFERQLPLVEAGADIVGSGLLEFGASVRGRGRAGVPRRRTRTRSAARSGSATRSTTRPWSTAAARCQAAGGYTDMALMEDYLLFARMVDARRAGRPTSPSRWSATGSARVPTPGAAAASCCAPSWPCSAGSGSSGSPPAAQYLRNVAVRGGYRLVPEALRKRRLPRA